MPVSERKWWVNKHNADIIEEEENIKRQGNKNKVTLSGDVLNDYAKTEQTMNKNAGFI